MLTNDTYEPDDTDPWYLPSGQAINTERVLSLGEVTDSRRAFSTRVQLVDRLGQERTFGLVIQADSRREAELRARARRLGEVVTGEIVNIIPAGGTK